MIGRLLLEIRWRKLEKGMIDSEMVRLKKEAGGDEVSYMLKLESRWLVA